MIDEKKMEKRLKNVAMFFFIQPLLTIINSSGYSNFISLGILIIMAVIWIAIGFGLKSREKWARVAGMIVCAIQGVLSVAVMAWFPSYFIETVKGGNFLWLILLAEGAMALFAFAYFLTIWRLNTKEMKEYFALRTVTVAGQK